MQLLDQTVIYGSVGRLPPGTWLEEVKQKGIHLTDIGRSQPEIEILIGADEAGKLYSGKLYNLSNGLVAMETYLGWVIMGKMSRSFWSDSSSNELLSLFTQSKNLEDLWKLETIGITDTCENISKSEIEKAVVSHFEETVKTNSEGRYEISLPWVNDRNDLPVNKTEAERRLHITTAKLESAKRFEDYNAVFETWIQDGVIEEVIDKSEKNSNVKGHYIPHRGVFKETSTTRVRPVFDASFRVKGYPSLNDCLAKGPNLLELIPTILFKFREKKIGVISDIKGAFLQISVNEEDRDYLRFLWWKDRQQSAIRIFRHCRVVFGVNCSPFLLAAVIEFHLRHCKTEKEIAKKLQSSFYVDNCVTSVDSEEELNVFISKATSIMSKAKFELRCWEHTQIHNDCTLTPDPAKVLGLLWDKQEDSLFCDVQKIELGELPVTRRNVLSLVQKVFDPIGFSCPLTLLPKLLLQRSWEAKLSWDAELPEHLKGEFLKWLEELPLLSSLKIPRKITMSNSLKYSLHVFSDASRVSYATIAYLRCENEKKVKVQLLQAKSRVAPLRKITIPRLELLACVIGARLAYFVKKNLGIEIEKEYYWTDSSTVLSWVKKKEPWGAFVNNRVKEIRDLTRTEDWRHVPGIRNPADLPSRGCSATKLIESRWWEGPNWLRNSENGWPQSNPVENVEEVNTERRKSILTLNCKSNTNDWMFSYFSSYTKILRMVAWMLRFTRNTRLREKEREKGELKVYELSVAEKLLVKLVQQESFNLEDIKNLKSVCVFKDEENIWRVQTKLTARKDHENFLYPMLLPSKHKLVEYLILSLHLSLSHAGLHVLMSKLRENFWIMKTRKTIRRVLARCTRCKRHESKRMQCIPAALPEHRIRDSLVFEVTGIDLAGPLTLKDKKKAWIILFTCAVYRGIHLELITSLSTQSFLLGLRRFIARRGRPKFIYCDNGSNFVGSCNLLKSFDWKVIEVEASIRRIQWIFNPPAAPWWGGFWERMIQMVKKLLRRVLGLSSLDYEELVSVLCDCEATINSRPLTSISEDSDELIPLTPAMFMGEIVEGGVPDLDHLDRVNLNKRLRYLQRLRDTLKERFRIEYLSHLLQRPSKVQKGQNIKVGDIVLIENESKRRTFWPMARIIQIYPGKDGEIRVARVKTASGEVVRPIQRVFPLEIHSVEPTNDEPVEDQSTPEGNDTDFLRSKIVMTKSGRRIKLPSRYLN